jgi:hypothetical protein
MPRTSKAEAPVGVDSAQIQGRYAELGPYTVAYETYPQDADPAPLFAGLPDGRCQCPHWGTVVTGQVVFRYADHDEVFRAGDAYYAAPGHVPLVLAGTELVEFSPTRELQQTMTVVGAAMQAMAEGV